MYLPDTQSEQPTVAIALHKVGVHGLAFRLRLRDREQGQQEVAATASLSVSLAAHRRGAHMSRFVEVLDAWDDALGCRSMRRLLTELQRRLEATQAFADFTFSYLARRQAPVSGFSALTAYDCRVSATLDGSDLAFELGISVPVMTVCPCSLAISDQGAHCQRALVHIQVSCRRFIWLEELIAMAESAGSAPVYPLLKRTDEKFITELAFSHAAFVEDVARSTASSLDTHANVMSWKVQVESMESIHSHNAFACVESNRNNP